MRKSDRHAVPEPGFCNCGPAPVLIQSSTMNKTKSTNPYPERAKDVLVNQAMLFGVRDDLRSEIRSVGHHVKSLDSKIDSLDLKVDSLDLKVASLDLKVDSLDHKIDSLDHKIDSLDHKLESKFEKIQSDIHQMKVLFEEQNHRNSIVLDGLSNLFERQERIENESSEFRQMMLSMRSQR
jgi:chromosome segregation ATPase